MMWGRTSHLSQVRDGGWEGEDKELPPFWLAAAGSRNRHGQFAVTNAKAQLKVAEKEALTFHRHDFFGFSQQPGKVAFSSRYYIPWPH